MFSSFATDLSSSSEEIETPSSIIRAPSSTGVSKSGFGGLVRSKSSLTGAGLPTSITVKSTQIATSSTDSESDSSISSHKQGVSSSESSVKMVTDSSTEDDDQMILEDTRIKQTAIRSNPVTIRKDLNFKEGIYIAFRSKEHPLYLIAQVVSVEDSEVVVQWLEPLDATFRTYKTTFVQNSVGKHTGLMRVYLTRRGNLYHLPKKKQKEIVAFRNREIEEEEGSTPKHKGKKRKRIDDSLEDDLDIIQNNKPSKKKRKQSNKNGKKKRKSQRLKIEVIPTLRRQATTLYPDKNIPLIDIDPSLFSDVDTADEKNLNDCVNMTKEVIRACFTDNLVLLENLINSDKLTNLNIFRSVDFRFSALELALIVENPQIAEILLIDHFQDKKRTPLPNRSSFSYVNELLTLDEDYVSPFDYERLVKIALTHNVSNKIIDVLKTYIPDILPVFVKNLYLGIRAGNRRLVHYIISHLPISGEHWGFSAIFQKLLSEKDIEVDYDPVEMISPLEINRGIAPVHVASINNLPHLKRILKQNIKAYRIKDRDGRSSIHYAAACNNSQPIEFLLNKTKVDPNATDKKGITPLMIAAKHGKSEVAKTLLDIDVVKEKIEYLTDSNKWTALHYAAYHAHKEIVELFIENNVFLEPETTDSSVPLHLAAMRGNLECIKALVDSSEVSLNRKDKNHNTALLLAARNGHLEVVSYLVHMGCKVYISDYQNNNVLHLASAYGWNHVLRFLLENTDIDINDINKQGITPIAVSVIKGHVACTKILASDKDIDLDVKDPSGKNLLHYACKRGISSSVRNQISDLLDIGIYANIPDKLGNTPLHIILSFEYQKVGNENIQKSIAILLLEGGADVNHKNREGLTPYNLVLRKYDEDLVRICLSKSADIRTPFEDNRNLLHNLTPNLYENSEKLTEFLHYLRCCDNSTDLCNKLDENGYTPLLSFVNELVIRSLSPRSSSMKLNSFAQFIFTYLDLFTPDINFRAQVKKKYRINIPEGLSEINFVIKKPRELSNPLQRSSSTFTRGTSSLTAFSKGKVPLTQTSSILTKINESALSSDEESLEDEFVDAFGNKLTPEAIAERKSSIKDLKKKDAVDEMELDDSETEETEEETTTPIVEEENKYDLYPGYSAAHYLALIGNVEWFSELLIRKTDFSVKDAYGNTPLHIAIKHKNFGVVELLLNNGVDPSDENNNGEMASTLLIDFQNKVKKTVALISQ
eukprot:TRINITY_DN6260_c0_g1_i1.p1 TRINITY_DN6260_c0_g1~~TRINITY_DN6260_c0_g1_i1.p1  ORF type:complete len:1214 (-),score=247.54 TRINITY_DN6260_c0_g1_i1:28-3669(-)